MKKAWVTLTMTAVLLTGLLPAAHGAQRTQSALNAGYGEGSYVDETGSLWHLGGRELPAGVIEGAGCTAYAFTSLESPAMLVRTDGTLLFFPEGFAGEGVEVMDRVVKAEMDIWGDTGCALDADGVLWGWGANHYGVLSPGGLALHEETGEMVPLLDRVADFSIKRDAMLALREDGTLWSWGYDDFGKLGSGGEGDIFDDQWKAACRETPVQVLDQVARMEMGVNHALAVRTDGALWAWGLCEELIPEGERDGENEYGSRYRTTPLQVMEGVKDVAAGHGTSYIIKTDGSLWTCGSNDFGEAGVGSTKEKVPVPTRIMEGVAEVAAGECFALVKKTGGAIWSFGLNDNGQLGNGYVGDAECILGPCQTVPMQIFPGQAQGDGLAYASTQTVLVNGAPVEFQAYALRDEKGNDTNFVKLRDVAYVLSGTSAQFDVGWDGAVNVLAGRAYTPNGSEMATPFSGDRSYQRGTAATNVNGTPDPMEAIVLTDDGGSGYTYYKLRDLGTALGFEVGWSAETGITIATQ